MSPEFTICTSVNTPPARVAAALAPLAALEAQIVLAIDDRADADWIDGYRQLADRVLLVPFPGNFARMYAWLREQCAGRWIVQLDLDEVPGADLAAELLETIADPTLTHAWVPRRWLYPDASTVLAQWPWRPDYALRLLRNDPALVRFPALLHRPVHAIGPRRYLRSPLYHADLLQNDATARARKALAYEREMPGIVIDGRSINEVYYRPELRSDLRLDAVGEQDAPLVAAFLAARAGDAVPRASRRSRPADVRTVSREEIERLSEGRSLDDDAYRAQLTLLDDDLRLVSGELRTFDIEVRNEGTALWPGGMDALPMIRLGYHRRSADGMLLDDGMRTGLPAPLRPGASAVVPLQLVGPADPGALEIEIDLVHEHVRWFGCAIRADIEVRPPAGQVSRPAPVARRRPLRRVRGQAR
jgi:hypothetical protein